MGDVFSVEELHRMYRSIRRSPLRICSPKDQFSLPNHAVPSTFPPRPPTVSTRLTDRLLTGRGMLTTALLLMTFSATTVVASRWMHGWIGGDARSYLVAISAVGGFFLPSLLNIVAK